VFFLSLSVSFRKPMSNYIENQKVKDGDFSEITLIDPALVSDLELETSKITAIDPALISDSIPDNSKLCQKDSSSESSVDSCEEKPDNDSSLAKKRANFKVRSRSDSVCNERTKPRGSLHKGILKLNSANRLRSLSESCAGIYCNSEDHESNSALNEWFKEGEDVEEEDGSGSYKVKKTVRFSDTIRRQLFRSNSSILGQRKKNQRKQRKKKRNDSHTLSSSAESENAVYIAQMSKTVVQLSLSDSGIEDSDLAEAESSSMSSSQSTNANKKNKKAKKGKNRARTASESNDLMFDIDL